VSSTGQAYCGVHPVGAIHELPLRKISGALQLGIFDQPEKIRDIWFQANQIP
jgi:hypothetical protein